MLSTFLMKKVPYRELCNSNALYELQASSHGLRQGAMVDGLDAPDKQKSSDDVQIVQSRLSEKQKAREIFAKRYLII